MLTNKQIRDRLFQSLFYSFYKKSVFLAFTLLIALLISSFMLIYIRFEYKQKLTQAQQHIVKKSDLDEQWSQIVLEYSSLAAPTSVEHFAQSSDMLLPDKNDIKFIKA